MKAPIGVRIAVLTGRRGVHGARRFHAKLRLGHGIPYKIKSKGVHSPTDAKGCICNRP